MNTIQVHVFKQGHHYKKKTCHLEDVFSGNCGSVLIDLSLYFVGYENDLIHIFMIL